MSSSVTDDDHHHQNNYQQYLGASQPVETQTHHQEFHQPLINFTDTSLAHGSKSTFELLRSIAVFKLCRIPLLVTHAESLLNLSTKILGRTITNSLVRHTFFNHFCAGTNSVDMKPVIDKLQECNIGPILDYAAESEEEEDDNTEGIIFTQPPFNQPARIYDYKSESECDKHVQVFMDCIHSVRDVSAEHNGFAALKVTALGNPSKCLLLYIVCLFLKDAHIHSMPTSELLERMTTMIVEVKNLFAKFDKNGSSYVSREEFIQCYEEYFHVDEDQLSEILDMLIDPNNGMIDYISFSQMFTPYTLQDFALKCREVGPLAMATPSNEEVLLMKKMSERLHTLAEEASNCGTKLLIDAEHLKYQPAIHNLVLELQMKYNGKDQTDRPVIFNTYQCYLKDTTERVVADLVRCERYNFHFGAKLVRGAYMVHERDRAKKLGLPSPIHDTPVDTHKCYDEVIELLLNHRVQHGPGLEMMIATHNKESIEKAVGLMDELGLMPDDASVHWAQLYGMSDNLTFTLGHHGYSAFKYLPYGEVQQVIPYLVRRAQENGDMLTNSESEVELLKAELKKRYLFT